MSTSPGAATPDPPRPAPTPRRVGRPRWLDPRVIGGVLLVVAAVVLGARVVGAGSVTHPVWVADGDLAAGTVLAAQDVRSAEVNLGEVGDRYIAATEPPVGLVLSVPLSAGELVPAGAVVPTVPGRIVVIPVEPERIPPGVAHGTRVDLYLTTEEVGTTGPVTELVAQDITVQSVSAPSSGGLSGASSARYQVAVQLEPPIADELVRLLPTGEVIVVLRTGERR